MSALLTLLAIVVAAALVLGLTTVLIYNGLRALQFACDDAWSLIDVQLRRRADLVPNLVAIVAAYADHERAVLDAAGAARATALTTHGASVVNAQAEGALGACIASVVAVGEAYPELRASANFLQLQRELSDLEGQIAASREIYNGNAASYRTRCQQLPSAWVARPFHFPSRELFALTGVSDRLPSAATLQA